MKTAAGTPKFIYWKEELKNRPWKLIPDTSKARNLAIKQGAMFFTNMALSEPYKDNGQPEPTRFGDLPLDFDNEKDPSEALKELRALCLLHLPELFDLDPYAISYYVSGKKGFHAIMPAELLGAQDGDPQLPLIYKNMVSTWKEQFNLKTLDLALYNMGKGRMFRLPNVKRANGKYKIPVTLEEVQGMLIDELIELSEGPREIEPVDFDLKPVVALAELYKLCKEEITRKTKRKRTEPKTSQKVLSKEIPLCIKYILTEGPKTNNSSFNKLVMNLVTYFQSAGFGYDAAIEAAKPFLMNYEHSTGYPSAEDRLRHWDSQWEYLQGKDDYTFECSFILGLGFLGSAFECDNCSVNKNEVPSADTPADTNYLPPGSKKNINQDVSARVREYLLDEFNGGIFKISDLKRELGLNDKQYTAARGCVKRMVEQELIQKHGHQLGCYRVVDKTKNAIVWDEVEATPSGLILPCDLNKMINIRKGDMICFAAFKNQSKSALAVETVRLNLDKFKIHFFITEYKARMKARLLNFGIDLSHPNLKCYPIDRSDYIPDKIEPGEGVLNIIDHFPNLSDFYSIGKYQDEIHRSLDGAICVITHQKKKEKDNDAIGGSFWQITPTLAVSIFPEGRDGENRYIMKIIKGKEPALGVYSANGKKLEYQLIKGCEFGYDPNGWK